MKRKKKKEKEEKIEKVDLNIIGHLGGDCLYEWDNEISHSCWNGGGWDYLWLSGNIKLEIYNWKEDSNLCSYEELKDLKEYFDTFQEIITNDLKGGI